MNRPELYHKTVDILVQAYFNDTLEHNNCYACAVGNLVAANNGFVFEKCTISGAGLFGRLVWKGYNGGRRSVWSEVVCTFNHRHQDIIGEHYIGAAKSQIDSTGYTLSEFAKIEFAFESAKRGKSKDEYMFNGLCAVIDALDKIHDNKDPEVSTKSKNRFAKV